MTDMCLGCASGRDKCLIHAGRDFHANLQWLQDMALRQSRPSWEAFEPFVLALHEAYHDLAKACELLAPGWCGVKSTAQDTIRNLFSLYVGIGVDCEWNELTAHLNRQVMGTSVRPVAPSIRMLNPEEDILDEPGDLAAQAELIKHFPVAPDEPLCEAQTDGEEGIFECMHSLPCPDHGACADEDPWLDAPLTAEEQATITKAETEPGEDWNVTSHAVAHLACESVDDAPDCHHGWHAPHCRHYDATQAEPAWPERAP